MSTLNFYLYLPRISDTYCENDDQLVKDHKRKEAELFSSNDCNNDYCEKLKSEPLYEYLDSIAFAW